MRICVCVCRAREREATLHSLPAFDRTLLPERSRPLPAYIGFALLSLPLSCLFSRSSGLEFLESCGRGRLPPRQSPVGRRRGSGFPVIEETLQAQQGAQPGTDASLSIRSTRLSSTLEEDEEEDGDEGRSPALEDGERFSVEIETANVRLGGAGAEAGRREDARSAALEAGATNLEEEKGSPHE